MDTAAKCSRRWGVSAHGLPPNFLSITMFELFSRLGTNPFPSSLVSFPIYTSWRPQLYKLNPVIVVTSCYIRDKPQLATLRDIVNLAFEGRLTVVVFIGVSFWKRQLNWACHTMESPNQAGFRGSQQTRFQSGLNIKATPQKKVEKWFTTTFKYKMVPPSYKWVIIALTSSIYHINQRYILLLLLSWGLLREEQFRFRETSFRNVQVTASSVICVWFTAAAIDTPVGWWLVLDSISLWIQVPSQEVLVAWFMGLSTKYILTQCLDP